MTTPHADPSVTTSASNGSIAYDGRSSANRFHDIFTRTQRALSYLASKGVSVQPDVIANIIRISDKLKLTDYSSNGLKSLDPEDPVAFYSAASKINALCEWIWSWRKAYCIIVTVVKILTALQVYTIIRG